MRFLDLFKKKNKGNNSPALGEAEKLKRKVFPGGDVQVDNETTEICSLLNYKHPYEKIKHVYAYSASVFFLSKDRSYESIGHHILTNREVDLTKDESIMIYNYLVEKFRLKTVTKIVNDLNDSFSVGDNLFHIATGATVELESNFKDMSPLGKFELIILNTILIASELKENDPENIQYLQDLYFKVIDEAKSLGVSGSDETIAEYINTRTTFFQDELALFHQKKGHLLGKIYSCIYVSPLKEEPELSNNLIEIMGFTGGYVKMVIWIKEQVHKL